MQKNRRKNNSNAIIKNEIGTSPQQPKVAKVNNKDTNVSVSTFECFFHIIIGPRKVGKTFYTLKILEILSNKRPIPLNTRSFNQNPNYKTSTENKPIDKYKGSVVIFDDMLGARNSSQINAFFTRGRNENLDVYYIRESFF